MKKHALIVLAMTGLACMLPASSIAQNVSTGGTNPNVIVILADDLGYGDLGCYGGTKIKTPNIDRLAAQGVRFTDFYVPAAICTPSRAALMTGRYPIRNGLTGLLWPHSKDGIDAGELTIAELLKTRGYATGLIGKWHLGHQPQHLPMRHGFDEWFGMPWPNDQDQRHPLAKILKQDWPPLPLYRDAKIVEQPVELDSLTQRYTQECIRFIETHKDKPFFLYYASHAPHTYLAASKDFRGKSAGGLFCDMVEELDWSVGQITQALNKHGLDRKTLVFFSNDNGAALKTPHQGPAWEGSDALFHPDGSYGSNAPLRGGKQATFEGGVRVPAIAWGPGVRAGQVERRPAIIMDLLPTIAAAAGADLPKDRVLDGENLMPVLAGTGHRHGQEFFFFTGQKITGIRSGKWKLKIEPPSKAATAAQDAVLLFDLEQDVGEGNDLAAENPQIATELLRKVDEFRKSLGTIPPAKK